MPGLASRATLLLGFAFATALAQQPSPAPAGPSAWEAAFLKVPDARLAGQHLHELTKAPHPASSPEDYATAKYVAQKFREAGLETEIVPYRVVLAFPETAHYEATAPDGFHSEGPHAEHVEIAAGLPQDPGQNDKRILPPYNASSASGEVTADVVYGNYGRPQDFEHLKDVGIDLRGKLVLVRYGGNFRGVKAFLAQRYGAAGVIIYSDPKDDGADQGKTYPDGPWRPASGVQRGSIGYIFEYPGDPQTPGVASTPNLPGKARVPLDQAVAQPKVLAIPISSADAAPLMARLTGPLAPQDWQGGLGGEYHVGPGPVRVHLTVRESYNLHTIWDVVGKLRGEDDSAWVVAGNHRDAWVYGACDPNSGTAAMLEAVHGLGELHRAGWKPKRTIVIGSWDAEEEGLIGSTEWAEQNADKLRNAVAYFNTDVAVDGPNFNASAVPSLRGFLRGIARDTPAAAGGSVYDQWKKSLPTSGRPRMGEHRAIEPDGDVRIGTLGSGSDFSAFFQHLGIASTDIGSSGPGGVYHSAFDDYVWFTRFADPDFHLLAQQARVFGMEIVRMADAPVLPLDEKEYATEIARYLHDAEKNLETAKLTGIDFTAANAAAGRMLRAATMTGQSSASLHAAEAALVSDGGIPRRPWYRNVIFAPGETTGYAAVTLPALADAVDAKDSAAANAALAQIERCLNNAAAALEKR